MKFTFLTLLASCALTVSAAETSPTAATAVPTSDATCAKEIVQACLERMEPQLKKCSPNRWDCLCEQTNNVLTCYNNCPSHPSRTTTSQQLDSYCRAAKAASMTVSTSTSATPTKTDSSASKTQDADASSSSAAEADATSSSSGAAAAAGAGVMGAAGVVGSAVVVGGLVVLGVF